MIRQNVKFTEQKLNAAAPATSAGLIDFLQAQDRLQTELKRTDQESEMARKAGEVARRMQSAQADRFEESLYWLLSAATLGYLVLEIIGF
jgi:mannitol-1-phosphate/altronate dehydrogenase